MELRWSSPDSIATALLAVYPDVDRLALTPESVRQMVVSLAGFADTPQPPTDKCLDDIVWRWMRAADTVADPDTGSGTGD